MRIASAGLALLLAGGAVAPSTPAVRAEDRVIFTAELMRESWKGSAQGREFWTPTVADALALEQRLPDFLRHELVSERRKGDKTPPLWQRAPLYKRQYFGTKASGIRLIQASFFCRELNGWRTGPVVVKDGGDCFFSVNYNVDKQTFSSLIINGEA